MHIAYINVVNGIMKCLYHGDLKVNACHLFLRKYWNVDKAHKNTKKVTLKTLKKTLKKH